MNELRELLDKTESIKPIGNENGQKVVSIEEQRDMAYLEHVTGGSTLGSVQFNPDGMTVARTPGNGTVAVNPDTYFLNRYKKVKDTLYVVTDSRAIKEQDSGMVYLKTIPAHVIKRGENGQLRREKVVMISDTEFIADFINKLDREAMAVIKPLIDTGVEVTPSGLPI